MKKRIISLLLVICMLLSMAPAALAGDLVKDVTTMSREEKEALLRNPFADVREDDWFFDAVQYVRINSIFNGVSETSFDPNGTMTRGMFVTVLGRMAGVDTAAYAGESAFADVPSDAYYAPYVAWAAKHNITTGTGAGMFSPNALITRQQMAAFFVRYFETFDVVYETGEEITTLPADLDEVALYAKSAVIKLWKQGLLNGDGVNFDPNGNAARAQTATLCMRTDNIVEVWYKEPGVPSDRVRIDPDDLDKILACAITFYDGERLIDRFTVPIGYPLTQMPAVEDYSKPGAILVGYYLDEEFTEPFYPDVPFYRSTRVYAKYQEMESTDALTVTTYTKMDQPTTLSFDVRSLDGTPVNNNTVLLETKDGSKPNTLAFSSNGSGITTVSAVGGFTPGVSYELHLLSNALIFDGKADTIRSASFSIARGEEEELSLGSGVKYIPLTEVTGYSEAGGSFGYSGATTLAKDNIVCLYSGADPRTRSAIETANDAALLDPVTYVKITAVNADGTYSFGALSQEDQIKLYELPDNFPLYVAATAIDHEAETGVTDIDYLDISMYENMLGAGLGTLSSARSKINVGDFITLYSGEINDDTVLYFGRITAYDPAEGTIEYRKSSEAEILGSMDLYANIDLAGTDLVSDDTAAAAEAAVEAQLEESGFAEEAAEVLANVVLNSGELSSGSEALENMLRSGASGSSAAIDVNGYDLRNIDVSAKIIRSGEQLHFSDGVQMRVTLSADMTVPAGPAFSNEPQTLTIKLNASFIEEVSIAPGVKGELTHTKILGIPVPNGVKVDAHVDVKNYTNFNFDAEIYTGDVNTGNVAQNLEKVITVADKEGLGEEYDAALQELMDKYSELVTKETDWVKLVQKDIFSKTIFVYGLSIKVDADFVVNADMSLAIGSDLEYEVGKRYSFWFKIGLYKPTAGSDTMDIIDEHFAFNFYVLGKLGVRAGVKASISAGIGVASVGISAEMGPYIKLWGFFVYQYDKLRPAGSKVPVVEKRTDGALALEFGLYFVLSFEADALGLFEYSYDFLNEEVPLLTSGSKKYYYDLIEPMEDEMVLLVDSDPTKDGISMPLPEIVRTMKYLNLETGVQGIDAAPAEYFNVTLSHPAFSYDKDSGMLTVTPDSDRVYFLECDMTVTYNRGKQTLTDYDMTITIPLVYTLLSYSERSEYKYVSVCVTDGDNYETVWGRKVLKGQQFDLPAPAEIKDLANWSDLKYIDGSGYIDTPVIEDLTVVSDTVYYYDVDFRTYSITVNNIEGASKTSETYTTIYGGTFDFTGESGKIDLSKTGTNYRAENDANSVFTRFTNVTTMMQAETAVTLGADGKYGVGMETIDLTQPITGKVAEALLNGGTAKANYEDNSVTAVFSFTGVNVDTNIDTNGDGKNDNAELKLRRGDNPANYLSKIVNLIAAEGNDASGKPISYNSVNPAFGPIDQSTSYTLYCVELSGERALVNFDTQSSGCDACGICSVTAPDPMDKLVGSMLFNLPVIERTGYIFEDWWYQVNPPAADEPDTGSEGGENGGTETASVEDDDVNIDETAEVSSGSEGEEPEAIALAASEPVWDLATRTTLPTGGITLYAKWTPITINVSFDTRGGELMSGTDSRVVTYDSTYGIVAGEDVAFPTATRTGYHFLGWYDAPDTDETVDDTTANLVTKDSDVTSTTGVKLYAHWRQLKEIPQSVIEWGAQKTAPYADGAPIGANVSVNSGTGYPTDFVIEYLDANKENAEWTEQIPYELGTYHVRVTRPIDEYYLAFDARRDSMVTITKADRTSACLKSDYSVTMTSGNIKVEMTAEASYKLSGQETNIDGVSLVVRCKKSDGSWEILEKSSGKWDLEEAGKIIKNTELNGKVYLAIKIPGTSHYNQTYIHIGEVTGSLNTGGSTTYNFKLEKINAKFFNS